MTGLLGILADEIFTQYLQYFSPTSMTMYFDFAQLWKSTLIPGNWMLFTHYFHLPEISHWWRRMKIGKTKDKNIAVSLEIRFEFALVL